MICPDLKEMVAEKIVVILLTKNISCLFNRIRSFPVTARHEPGWLYRQDMFVLVTEDGLECKSEDDKRWNGPGSPADQNDTVWRWQWFAEHLQLSSSCSCVQKLKSVQEVGVVAILSHPFSALSMCAMANQPRINPICISEDGHQLAKVLVYQLFGFLWKGVHSNHQLIPPGNWAGLYPMRNASEMIED